MNNPEITIENLAVGGKGVGRVAGQACFVPFSAPGDRMTIRITNKKRNYLEGEMLELLEPSPWRTVPLCPAFGSCGGCNWQHLDYSYQCQTKRNLLADLLRRIARFSEPLVEDTVAAPSAFGYRARAQFKLFATPEKLLAGFYKNGSRYVVDLPDGCPIVTLDINMAMQRLRNLLEASPERHLIPQLSIEEGTEGVVAIVHYIGQEHKQLKAFLLKHREQLQLHGLWLQSRRKDSLEPVFGSNTLSYNVPAWLEDRQLLDLKYDIGSFSQVNRSQNRVLIRLVHGLLEPHQAGRLLDVYCGNGNLSLPLAGLVSGIVGVEEYPPSIASAIDNVNGISVNSCTFRCCSASAEVERLLAEKEQFDYILIDPPRSGAADIAGRLALFNARRIVYVSCDPATFARDAATIVKTGYQLSRAIPLDMFPHTAHLETVALFVKP